MHNLFSLPHLLAIHTKGKEPLIDYSQYHIVTSNQYLNIMRKKAMDKATTREIKEDRQKEREEKRLKIVIDVGFVVDQTTQKTIEKWLKHSLLQLGF
jgi:hypothetical protein